MDTANRIQISDKALCISNRANILGKYMNLSILSPAMGKIVGQDGLYNYCMATSLGELKTLNLIPLSFS